MADLLFIGVVVAFFALAGMLVRACEAIVGPDPQAPVDTRSSELAAAQGPAA